MVKTGLPTHVPVVYADSLKVVLYDLRAKVFIYNIPNWYR